MENSTPTWRLSQKEHDDLESAADATVLVLFLQRSRSIRWLRTCWRKLAYDLMALLAGLRPVILLDYVFASSPEIASLLQRLAEECCQVRRVAFVHMKNCHYLLNTARLRDLDPAALVGQGLMKFVVLKRGVEAKIAEHEEAAYYKNHLVKIYCSLVRGIVGRAPPIQIQHPEVADPPPPDVGSIGGLDHCAAGQFMSNQMSWRGNPATHTQALFGSPIAAQSRHNDLWTATASTSSSPPCSHSKDPLPSNGRPNSTVDPASSQTGVFGASTSDSVIAAAEGCYLHDIFTSDEIPLPTINGMLRHRSWQTQTTPVGPESHTIKEIDK
ncbi:hypothetical protein CBR_g24388 [Chara braunii]|uniref:Uncharacterized protein n=1 Tax=Chara braunii TaxID=69332 RepID=A0A388JMW2_CHABU|nr:hypothetical protein CBR_g24388 [Chara braunii]|eukprot:GBG59042.1 hypothetical protein CBR_g24388 [Chara braunii]